MVRHVVHTLVVYFPLPVTVGYTLWEFNNGDLHLRSDNSEYWHIEGYKALARTETTCNEVAYEPFVALTYNEDAGRAWSRRNLRTFLNLMPIPLREAAMNALGHNEESLGYEE